MVGRQHPTSDEERVDATYGDDGCAQCRPHRGIGESTLATFGLHRKKKHAPPRSNARGPAPAAQPALLLCGDGIWPFSRHRGQGEGSAAAAFSGQADNAAALPIRVSADRRKWRRLPACWAHGRHRTRSCCSATPASAASMACHRC